ncbi:hypothetical protein PISL3812_00015 [Talaromyces islandicus]|uniref:ATP-grasp domain-containing protein n=1 Tax=Talaromyces islandicus TaxID=28573 RepID=A0A0U1LKN7_TALIS|nr:hypothetical protein PISL3812_00015 [Talaromyces islandicus]
MQLKTPITLDYTLYDLYSIDNEQSNTILVYNPLQTEDHELLSQSKFTYQFMLQEENNMTDSLKMLSAKLVPQRYGFSAGKMSLIIPDLDVQSSGNTNPDYTDVFQNLAQLPTCQQPTVGFEKDLRSLNLKPGAHIAAMFPSDSLLHLPHIIDPSVHFEILSKRGLALSGLPTPVSEVIDSVLSPSDVQDPALRNREVARMIKQIEEHPLPFLLKLPQTVSGVGVFKISTDTDRARVKGILDNNLGGMLWRINNLNHDIHPCSLVLQEYICGTVMALSMFITKKGRPIFIACCEQRFDEYHHWIGGTISYKQQRRLENFYSNTMKKVAGFLHRKGYYGPAGVDIITDKGGNNYIIDLNVRITGTYHLGLLGGHFVQRGIFEATMITSYFPCLRTTFEEIFAKEIQNGRIIITGWVHDKSTGHSCAAINVGGTDSLAMEQMLKKVKAHALAG